MQDNFLQLAQEKLLTEETPLQPNGYDQIFDSFETKIEEVSHVELFSDDIKTNLLNPIRNEVYDQDSFETFQDFIEIRDDINFLLTSSTQRNKITVSIMINFINTIFFLFFGTTIDLFSRIYRIITCRPPRRIYNLIAIGTHTIEKSLRIYHTDYDYDDYKLDNYLQDFESVNLSKNVKEELVYNDFGDYSVIIIWILYITPFLITIPIIYNTMPFISNPGDAKESIQTAGVGLLAVNFIIILNTIICVFCILDKFFITKNSIGISTFFKALKGIIKSRIISLIYKEHREQSFIDEIKSLQKHLTPNLKKDNDYRFYKYFNLWKLIPWTIFILISLFFVFLSWILHFAAAKGFVVFDILTVFFYFLSLLTYPTFTFHHYTYVDLIFKRGNNLSCIMTFNNALKLKKYLKFKKDDIKIYKRNQKNSVSTPMFIQYQRNFFYDEIKNKEIKQE